MERSAAHTGAEDGVRLSRRMAFWIFGDILMIASPVVNSINGKPGDLIEILRGFTQKLAVYIGENEVVHFGTDSGQSSGSLESLSSRGEVKREKLADVVGHHHHHINNLLDDMYDSRDPSIIVKEAREMVGRVLKYNIVTSNSEDFATEMRYGKEKSRQFNGKPGDLIQIFLGLYWHWAVYIGGNEVVHLVREGGLSSGWFTSLSSSTGNVKREKLADVVGHHHFKVNNLLDNSRKPRDPPFIVKEACEMVDSELPYNVVTNNSEDFATEMRYGKAVSCQVKITTWLAEFGGAAAALVIGGPVAAVRVAGAAVAGSVFGRQLRSRSRSKEEIYPF